LALPFPALLGVQPPEEAGLSWVSGPTAGLMALADDETTLFGFPLVAQVWAVR
jgi:hypothetical protein